MLIRWIVTCPVDIAIQHLNNLGQMVNEKKNCIIKILESNFQYQNAKE